MSKPREGVYPPLKIVLIGRDFITCSLVVERARFIARCTYWHFGVQLATDRRVERG